MALLGTVAICASGKRNAKAGRSQAHPRGFPSLRRGSFGSALATALLIASGLVMGASPAGAAPKEYSEREVKAAFLINFPKYVRWPDTAFATNRSPILVAAPAGSELARELEKIVEGRHANGRPIALKKVAPGERPSPCHVRFITAKEMGRPLLKVGQAGVLTVGESDEFIDRGGIVNFARRDGRLSIEINVSAADQAGLGISSQLLSVASVVKANGN